MVQRGDPHPELRKLYSNYYNKSVFREIAEASVSKGITNLGIEWHGPID